MDMPAVPGLDKAAHFCVYGVLAAAVIFAHSTDVKRQRPGKTAFTAVAVCLLFGISDEFHQAFVPGRFVSGMDLAADFLGGLIISLFWLQRSRSRAESLK